MTKKRIGMTKKRIGMTKKRIGMRNRSGVTVAEKYSKEICQDYI